MKRNKEQLYKPGKTKQLVERVAVFAARRPDFIRQLVEDNDFTRLHAVIAKHEEGYAREDTCHNCGHHMKIVQYKLGVMEGMLLFAMAKSVKHERNKDVSFTEANKVHIPSLETLDSVRHTITKASYLGVVAQPENLRGTGFWVITHWGWKLLRGERIARCARFYRGNLIDRSTEQTDLAEMFRTHTDMVERAISRRKAVKSDYRAIVSEYRPSDWTDFGGLATREIPETLVRDKTIGEPWWMEKN